MTSVDELFKGVKHSGSASSSKRKLDSSSNPADLYKAAKVSASGDVHTPTVEDEDEEVVAGPSRPPAYEEGDDEEEGRFFGTGVTRDAADALEFLDGRDDDVSAPEKIDAIWVRRLATNLEKRISKNAELRAKFENDPQKFMSSEGDLDSDIKSLSVLTDHPELYSEFAEQGCVAMVVSLLAHENTDIAIDAVQILAELTDEDVQAEQEQWDAIVDAMLRSDLSGLLTSNLERLDEANEFDREGVYYSLSLAENLASQIKASEELIQSSSILNWLLERIHKRETPTSQNKQYAAEVLAILLQSSPKNRSSALALDSVDLFLQLLSAYRKRDPEKDSEEEEFAENVFDCLTCTVDDEEGKTKFIEAEGVELCLIMLKEGKFSKERALRLLDHAVGGQTGMAVCEKIVDAAGLKTLFTMFMKQTDRSIIEHLLGIFASMLRLLPGGSAARIRTLAKFVEKDYEKTDKLIKLRREYASRLGPVQARIVQESRAMDAEERAENEDAWLSRLLDAGLFSSQTIDVILAWLIAEDGGAKKHVAAALAAQDQTLANIRATLREQAAGLEHAGDDEAASVDMLNTLIDFLQ